MRMRVPSYKIFYLSIPSKIFLFSNLTGLLHLSTRVYSFCKHLNTNSPTLLLDNYERSKNAVVSCGFKAPRQLQGFLHQKQSNHQNCFDENHRNIIRSRRGRKWPNQKLAGIVNIVKKHLSTLLVPTATIYSDKIGRHEKNEWTYSLVLLWFYY